MGHSILEKFAVLEGLDGAGTTTQLRLLDARLSAEGTPHMATWEPTDGSVGTLIRSVLSRAVSAMPRTIAMLYAADRNEHVNAAEGVYARTSRGELVVSDRYLFSSLAYQSIECGFDYVLALNADFPLPSRLFFIDTPVEVCQRRIHRRGEPELFDDLDFQRRVREAYFTSFEKLSGSGMILHVLDGELPEDDIHSEIWKVLSSLPIT